MPLRRALLGLCIAGMAGLLAVGFFRVAELERAELEHEGAFATLEERLAQPSATRISARLTEVELREGERAVFEVCARGDLASETFRDTLDFVVWVPSRGKKELHVPLDAAHQAVVRRNPRGSCLKLGEGRIEASGEYAVDAVFHGKTVTDAVRAVPLRARVLASAHLSRSEGLIVWGIALLGLLAVFSGFTPTVRPVERGGSVGWLSLGLAVGLGLAYVVLSLPLGGSVGGMSRGLSICILEIGVAIAFSFHLGRARDQLALHAPSRAPGLWLLAAVGSALLLSVLARLSLRLVPSTGEAPIETFISWPSGALAFAVLGMVVPLAEELFFRGFVFGALEHRGRGLAFGVTLVAFTAAHVQQSWGNWGALLAVTITGALLTGLRAVTGSTLVPAVAHILYNLTLWIRSFG